MIFAIHIGGIPRMSAERDLTSGGYPVYSRAFICPWCLTLWATSHSALCPPYALEATPCEACPPTGSHPVPGSILDNFTFGDLIDWELLDLLPASLLRREFDLHIKQLDTETHSEHAPTDSPIDLPDLPALGSECPPRGSDWDREDLRSRDPR